MKNKYKSGSALITVVIVLVVALTGVVGFIVWQNVFSQKTKTANTSKSTDSVSKSTTSTGDSTTGTNTTTTETAALTDTTSDANFVITQWGIKGSYNGSYTVDYEIQGQSVDFTTPDSPSICQGRKLRAIIRYSSSDTITYHGHLAVNPALTPSAALASWGRSSIVKIGDYYYVLEQGVTDDCPGSTGAVGEGIEENVISGVNNLFNTLQAQ